MDANALLVHAWVVRNFHLEPKLPEDWNSRGPDYYNLKYNDSTGRTINAIVTKVADQLVTVQLFDNGKLENAQFPIGEAVKAKLTHESSVDDAYDSIGIASVLEKLSRSLFPGESKLSLQESSPQATDQQHANVQSSFQPPNQRADVREAPPVPTHAPEVPDLPRVPRTTSPPERGPGLLETPPGFDDDYEIFHSRRPQQSNIPSPFAPIGSDDLYPPEIGRDPSLRSIIGGSDSGRGHQGMHPTLDHPIFGGQGQSNEPDDLTRPPGARWDPTGPFGPGAPGPRGFGRGNSGGGGGNFI